MRRETTLLIDADLLIYRFACAAERPIDWGNDFWTLHSDARGARQLVDSWVEGVAAKTHATAVIMCVSDDVNFRYSVYPEYKSNRKDHRKPVCFGELRRHVLESYTSGTMANLEADDMMGLLANFRAPQGITGGGSPTPKPDYKGIEIHNPVIVSEDKDMLTVPCKLWRKGKLEVVTQAQAHYNHMTQTLVGDTTDGYPGCPGQGPVSSARTLFDTSNLWAAVVAAFEKKGLTEEDALVQARCAKILHEGYNFESGEVSLWQASKTS